jgi:lipid A 4'-phosphatase
MRFSLLIALIAATFAVFAVWPGLDLSVSAAFFDGAGFPVAQDARAETVRLIIWDLAIAVALTSAGLLGASLLLRKPMLRLPARNWGLILALFVLGPGVLVNGILKREWGRARPADTLNFGGTRQFTPPHDITDQCAANCSFVSGESAGAMALAIALWLILSAWRTRLPSWVFHFGRALIIMIPLITALQRVAAGRHFLSDTVLASLFVALLAAVLVRVLSTPHDGPDGPRP